MIIVLVVFARALRVAIARVELVVSLVMEVSFDGSGGVACRAGIYYW